MRLGATATKPNNTSSLSFNSSLVRLGVKSYREQIVDQLSFNSSLVRLGGSVCFWHKKPWSAGFQFQLGAIGSFISFKLLVSDLLFQFQLGAIGSQIELVKKKYADQVSIPAWCDWELMAKLFSRMQLEVSIPAWCDWEFFPFCKNFHIIIRFNSSLVRLGDTVENTANAVWR